MVIPLNDTIDKPTEIKWQNKDSNVNEKHLITGSNSSDIAVSVSELEKVKKEMTMMENALHGAARQAQVFKL